MWVRWQGRAESSFVPKAAKLSEKVKVDQVQSFARRDVIKLSLRAVLVEYGAKPDQNDAYDETEGTGLLLKMPEFASGAQAASTITDSWGSSVISWTRI